MFFFLHSTQESEDILQGHTTGEAKSFMFHILSFVNCGAVFYRNVYTDPKSSSCNQFFIIFLLSGAFHERKSSCSAPSSDLHWAILRTNWQAETILGVYHRMVAFSSADIAIIINDLCNNESFCHWVHVTEMSFLISPGGD
jgi:hypothetical protein